MGTQSMRFPFLLAAALALTVPVSGQGLPKQEGPAKAVKMFHIFCLSQLPDLEGVAQAAGFGEFAQITGPELEKYQPQVRAEELRAWRFHDAEDEFILTASKSKPDAQFKAQAPEFADSTISSCSLLMPAPKSKGAFLKEVVSLVGREPDETWVEGSLRAHAWTGQNEKLLSHVHYYEPVGQGGKGILSASTFVKD